MKKYPIVLWHAAPLVLQRTGEVCESMRFQNRQRDEGIRFHQQSRHLDLTDGLARNFDSGYLRKVNHLDAGFPGQFRADGRLRQYRSVGFATAALRSPPPAKPYPYSISPFAPARWCTGWA